MSSTQHPDALLQRLDNLVQLIDTSSSQPSQRNPGPSPESKQSQHALDNVADYKDESLVMSQEDGSYYYNRFGYLAWRQVAYKLMERYNLHDNEEKHTDGQTDSTKKKKKKKQSSKSNKRKWPKCVLTASGMNAISAVFHGIFAEHGPQPMNIIYSNELYDDTPKVVQYFKQHYNPNAHLIEIKDICDTAALRQLFQSQAVRNSELNVLFIECCSNPNGFVMDFQLIEVLRQSKGACYVIMDNTWLSSAIFNPFEHGADFVVISLSKYYSGGHCIGGAVLHHGQTAENVEVMNAISNWVRLNGIHISPYHCQLVLENMELMQDRIARTSEITRQCAELMHSQIGKCIMAVNHNSLETHVSAKMYRQYVHRTLYASVISFKIASTKMNQIRKWLASSKVLPAKTSFGGKDSRFDTYPYRDDDGKGTWCRFAVGYNDTFESVQAELQIMIDKLQALC